MLHYKKKFLESVIKWVDSENESTNFWNFEKDIVRIPGFNAAFQIWQIWRLGGQWSLGDWLKQPLLLLAKIDAIDTVYWTWKEFRYKKEENDPPRGLAALNGTQLEIVRVFDNGR